MGVFGGLAVLALIGVGLAVLFVPFFLIGMGAMLLGGPGVLLLAVAWLVISSNKHPSQ